MFNAAVAGLIQGGVYALLAVCVVVMFRMVRVLNFAQATIGAFGAYTGIVLAESGWPYLLALVAGALAAALLAGLCGAIMSAWFADASTEIRSTVAIGMMISILAIGFRLFSSHTHTIPELLPGSTLAFGDVIVAWSGVLMVLAAIVIAVGVALFLKYTTLGVRLRAQSERPQAAELLGVPARWLAVGVWALTGAASAIGILVVAPSRGSSFVDLGLLIVPALAAACIGLFRSTALAVVGGVMIGVISGVAQQWNWSREYQDALPFFVILIVLMWTQRGEAWDAAR